MTLGLVVAALCAVTSASAAPAAGGLSFDLRTIPFSRAGSYLAISRLGAAGERPAGVFLRTVRANPAHASVFVLEGLAGDKLVPLVETASPTRLHFEGPPGTGSVDVVFAEPRVLRIRGRGLGLRLRMWTIPPVNSAYRGKGDRWVVNNSPNGIKLMFTPKEGRIDVDAPWDGTKATRMAIDLRPGADGTFETALEEYVASWCERSYEGTFDEAAAKVEAEYRAFLRGLPPVAARYAPAAELAGYLLWSNIVEPSGHLRRPSVFVSKNLMTGVWSWDHGFNAMALAEGHPALAWDQLMLMFDLQDADGDLPDRVNDRLVTWAHNKPPVHGWMLAWMMKRSAYFRDPKRLATIYGPLSRWTEWWFRFRDDDRDGLPQYQHGNDSGWDNATPFLAGVPLESPDLPAFLALQMDALADVATRIGKPAEARRWRARADKLVADLLTAFVRDDRFVAYRSGDETARADGDSLMLFLPLILGERLPAPLRTKLLAALEEPGRFLTPHGLATESPRSRHYVPDGYWRGPIWAPSTMIMVEALRASGKPDLARDIARRFCEMARTTQMPENFDALTGKDLRDPGFAWTSAVYLVLAHELGETVTTRP